MGRTKYLSSEALKSLKRLGLSKKRLVPTNGSGLFFHIAIHVFSGTLHFRKCLTNWETKPRLLLLELHVVNEKEHTLKIGREWRHRKTLGIHGTNSARSAEEVENGERHGRLHQLRRAARISSKDVIGGESKGRKQEGKNG